MVAHQLLDHAETPAAQRQPETAAADPINHPPHYTTHPSGVQCIQITEHMDFLTGNAMKYLWRAGLKDGVSRLDDLRKCAWYVNRAIEKETHDGTEEKEEAEGEEA